ncbi:MAG: ribbon-helix-helix domain-containing protein [Nanoarchaeota archaeon]
MVMDTLQVRMNKGLLKRLDALVRTGIYSNRGEVIRDAVRRFVWEREVASVGKKGDSVKEVRKAREKLSKKKIDLDELNEL